MRKKSRKSPAQTHRPMVNNNIRRASSGSGTVVIEDDVEEDSRSEDVLIEILDRVKTLDLAMSVDEQKAVENVESHIDEGAINKKSLAESNAKKSWVELFAKNCS